MTMMDTARAAQALGLNGGLERMRSRVGSLLTTPDDAVVTIGRVAGSPGRRVAGSPGRRVAGSPNLRPCADYEHQCMAALAEVSVLPA